MLTDELLAAFEADVAALREPSDAQAMATVEHVVLALNEANHDLGGGAYETGEREQLCDYIDQTLTEAGIDIAALTSRLGIGIGEITDEWRMW